MRTWIPDLRTVFVCLAALSLAACGGGSGGMSSPASLQSPSASPPPPAAPTSFPLTTALATISANGLAANLKVSGTYKGISVGGSGSFNESSAAAATFEGQAALRQTVTLSASLTANPIPVVYNYSTTANVFTNSSYATLGLVDASEYDVAVAPFAYPATVAVGSSGNLGVMNRYKDSTKTTLLGTINSTYKVQAGTVPNTALFVQTDQSLDPSHNVTATVQMTYQITATGGVSLVGVSVTNSNASLTGSA